jgi:hypothetical protein
MEALNGLRARTCQRKLLPEVIPGDEILSMSSMQRRQEKEKSAMFVSKIHRGGVCVLLSPLRMEGRSRL